MSDFESQTYRNNNEDQAGEYALLFYFGSYYTINIRFHLYKRIQEYNQKI